jgi:hypothetical protein
MKSNQLICICIGFVLFYLLFLCMYSCPTSCTREKEGLYSAPSLKKMMNENFFPEYTNDLPRVKSDKNPFFAERFFPEYTSDLPRAKSEKNPFFAERFLPEYTMEQAPLTTSSPYYGPITL